MKKLSVCLIICIFILASIPATTVFAAENPGMIWDFSTEENFDEYVNNMPNIDECEIDWKDNMMHMTAIGKDPRVSFSTIDEEIDCTEYPFMKIGMKNPTDSTIFEMHYKMFEANIDGTCAVQFPISSKDTEIKEYVINIPETNMAVAPVLNESAAGMTESSWNGTLEFIRLDCLFFAPPSGEVPEGTEFYVEYVALFKTKADADAFDVKAYRTAQAEAKPTPAPATPTPAPVTPTPAANTAGTSTSTATKAPTEKEGDDSVSPFVIGGIAAAVIVIGAVTFFIIKKKK